MTEETKAYLTDEQFAVLRHQEEARTALAYDTMRAAIRQADAFIATQAEAPKLRDLFALAALHGLAAAEVSDERLAKLCFGIADAMMLARAADHSAEESDMDYNDYDDDERLAYIGLCAAQRLAHKTATDAGWYTDTKTGQPVTRNFGEVVALMHSELSEALEADRKGLLDDKLPLRDGREVEFADCILRIFDTAAAIGLDVAGAFIEKNRFNRKRSDHSLSARSAENGKKY